MNGLFDFPKPVQVGVKLFDATDQRWMLLKANPTDSGYDLRAREVLEMDASIYGLNAYGKYLLQPSMRCLVLTGIFLEMPPGLEAQVRSRSGLAWKSGVVVLNSPGTIDSGYRNEVGVILINHGSAPFTISEGDRIAQLVFCLVPTIELSMVSELGQSARGLGGFGSTGTK